MLRHAHRLIRSQRHWHLAAACASSFCAVLSVEETTDVRGEACVVLQCMRLLFRLSQKPIQKLTLQPCTVACKATLTIRNSGN